MKRTALKSRGINPAPSDAVPADIDLIRYSNFIFKNCRDTGVFFCKLRVVSINSEPIAKWK